MIIGRFLLADKERYAVIEEDMAYLIAGDIFGEFEKTGEVFQVSELKILPPIFPNKLIGIYANYRSAVSEIPKAPPMFFKARTSVIGADEKIVVPEMVTEVAYEGELAIVIKKKAKNVKARNAGEYILGYTGANDVTAKDFLGDGPWAKAKAFDSFQPLGRYLVITQDFSDIPVTLKVNGEVKQSSNSDDFIFSPQEIVEYLSSMMTLEPGDVILTGTPSGAGNLNHLDTVEVVVGNAGELQNQVVFEGR